MVLSFVRASLLTLFICVSSVPSQGEIQQIRLQTITLNDKALQRNLQDFVNMTKAKFIQVHLNKQDSLYRYKLTVAYSFEDVECYSRSFWGQLGNCVLLVTSQNQSDLNEVLTVSDTCGLDNLVRYARPFLPNHTTTTFHKGGIIEHSVMVIHGGIEWDFAINRGQELWFRTSDEFDSRNIILPN